MVQNSKFTGLTPQQISESRAKYGRNVLTPPARESLFRQFLKKFSDPLIIILLIAGVMSVGISFYEYFYLALGSSVFIEPVGIFIAIILATGLSFIFEYKAEKEFAILNKVNDEEPVQVIRSSNPCTIPRCDVVVGDIIVFEAGEEIPADAHLLEAMTLSIDESTLTGEPICHKTTDPANFNPDDTFPSDMVMRGTKVMEGHGIAEVTAVGDATENGKVFEAAQIDNSVKTPLNEQLDRLGHFVSITSYIIGSCVIIGRILMFSLQNSGADWNWMEFIAYTLQSIMLAVTLVVVAVPEGLPMAVTLSLAYSMRRMLRTGNLVRRMHACETMGAVTTICTDKTGTLTANRMEVADSLLGSTSLADMEQLWQGIAINSTANIDRSGSRPSVVGNPTEGALLLWMDADQSAPRIETLREARIIAQLPFSTERKFMATIYHPADSTDEITFVKGAPEILLDRCKNIAGSLTREQIESKLKEYQSMAMRTLGFAIQTSPAKIENGSLEADSLTFLGIVAISDPVRDDVPDAIRECINAGINIKIVTGDTPATAREIGRRIGLWIDADTDTAITTGRDIEAMTDEELQLRAKELKIIARARPMDKKRLVEALQREGEVVAVTGDGTNDAPALKAAHVGLSMGDGTSVAKEASDITIVNNSFSGITNAVMWGRSLFRNIQRFLLFQLTVNVAACLTVLAGSFMGTEAPLTVTQMLWVNLVMDTFAAMALASLPPSRSVMNDKPRKRTDFILNSPMKTVIASIGIFFAIIMIGLLYIMEHATIDTIADMFSPHLTGYKGLSDFEYSLFFTIFVILQWWNLFNARSYGSTASAFNLSKCSEFIAISGVILFGQILIATFGGDFFNVSPLSVTDWCTILLCTAPIILLGEIYRSISRHRHHSR